MIWKALVSAVVILNQWSREREKGFNSISSHLELYRINQFYPSKEKYADGWTICLYLAFIDGNYLFDLIQIISLFYTTWIIILRKNIWDIFSITLAMWQKKTVFWGSKTVPWDDSNFNYLSSRGITLSVMNDALLTLYNYLWELCQIYMSGSSAVLMQNIFYNSCEYVRWTIFA